MTKKKSLFLLFILLFILLIVVLLLIYLGAILTNKNTNENFIENKELNNNSMFSIMLETEAGAGIYEKSMSNTWPGEGYIFNEKMSVCENGSELSWNEELGAVTLSTGIADRCFVYFDKEPDIIYLADYIINNVYVEDGVNDLYYHDGQGTYTNAEQEAGDNSYRYSGANPNNYVCFGRDDEICPEDSLYRIIGIFDGTERYQVKLIKNTSIGSYEWDGDEIDFNNLISVNNQRDSYYILKLNGILAAPEPGVAGSNDWATADLNYYINNDNYFDKLDILLQNKIENHAWIVGGNTFSTIFNGTAKTVFQNEIVNPNETKTHNTKIGLMYISDYGYASSPENWTTIMSDFNTIGNNWMCIGLDEWTITPELHYGAAFLVSTKRIEYSGVYSNYNVRPTFYLNSDVTYVSGDGSQENPFRIE